MLSTNTKTNCVIVYSLDSEIKRVLLLMSKNICDPGPQKQMEAE